MTDSPASTPLKVTVHPLPQGQGTGKPYWNGEGPNFYDMLDIVNPLQHIPIISTLYQSLTGDVQSTGSKIVGGALFGGPIGLIATIFDTIMEGETGTGFGGNVLAALKGDPIPAFDRQVAENSPPYLTGSQRTAYNAYVYAQRLTA